MEFFFKVDFFIAILKLFEWCRHFCPGYFGLLLQFLLTKSFFLVCFIFQFFSVFNHHSYLYRNWCEAQLCLCVYVLTIFFFFMKVLTFVDAEICFYAVDFRFLLKFNSLVLLTGRQIHHRITQRCKGDKRRD